MEFIMSLPAEATMVEKMNMCHKRKKHIDKEKKKLTFKTLFTTTKDTTRAK